MEAEATILAAILGACLAAVLASVGYLYKTRQETRRSVRKVLYCLLEIKFALSFYRLDSNDAAGQLIRCALKRMADRWGVTGEDCPEEVRAALAKHFGDILLAMRPEIDAKLIDQLESALLELAQTHPILAFRIRGKQKLDVALSITKSYSETVPARFAAALHDERMREQVKDVGKSFGSNVIGQAIEMLNVDILHVAFASGIFHYLRCRFMPSLGELTLDFSMTNDAVDAVMGQLAQVLRQPNRANSESRSRSLASAP